MTRERCKELDEVWKAFREGKTVQWRVIDNSEKSYWCKFHQDWRDFVPEDEGKSYKPSFLQSDLDWRVKPEGVGMTKEQFENLRRGDIIRAVRGSEGVVVVSNYEGRITAIRTYDVTNPYEWILVVKSNY